MPSRNTAAGPPDSVAPRQEPTNHSIANLIGFPVGNWIPRPVPAAGYVAANRRGELVVESGTTSHQLDVKLAALEVLNGQYRVSKLMLKTSNRAILDRLHATVARCTPRRAYYQEMSLNVPNDDARRIMDTFVQQGGLFESLKDIPYVGQETVQFLDAQMSSGVLVKLTLSPAGARWPTEMQDSILDLLAQRQFLTLSMHRVGNFVLSSNTYEEVFLMWYDRPWAFVGARCKIRTSATVDEIKERSYTGEGPAFREEISGNSHHIECTHPGLAHVLQITLRFEATYTLLIMRFKDNQRGRLNSDTSTE